MKFASHAGWLAFPNGFVDAVHDDIDATRRNPNLSTCNALEPVLALSPGVILTIPVTLTLTRTSIPSLSPSLSLTLALSLSRSLSLSPSIQGLHTGILVYVVIAEPPHPPSSLSLIRANLHLFNTSSQPTSTQYPSFYTA